MNIIMKSKFGKTVISGIINKMLKKKLGYKLDLKLNDFDMIEDDAGNVRLHLDIDANIDKDELKQIFKEYF